MAVDARRSRRSGCRPRRPRTAGRGVDRRAALVVRRGWLSRAGDATRSCGRRPASVAVRPGPRGDDQRDDRSAPHGPSTVQVVQVFKPFAVRSESRSSSAALAARQIVTETYEIQCIVRALASRTAARDAARGRNRRTAATGAGDRAQARRVADVAVREVAADRRPVATDVGRPRLLDSRARRRVFTAAVRLPDQARRAGVGLARAGRRERAPGRLARRRRRARRPDTSAPPAHTRPTSARSSARFSWRSTRSTTRRFPRAGRPSSGSQPSSATSSIRQPPTARSGSPGPRTHRRARASRRSPNG